MGAAGVILYVVRFLIEVATVGGLIGGGLLARNVSHKLLFPLLGIAIVVVWSLFGAPKAKYALQGIPKLMLEIVVFGIGAYGFFKLFGERAGIIYTVTAFLDLALIYLLRLQGVV